ncbi:uncharacterized protein LOC112556937 [Pomacea canaliculata]|uniref:uncharacterized protein LOC112556937 n=1 Tax=Pomacea canaliculata TaxID=400727 RepID=UPI000D72F130|nr:uncharacterized protein LOC112556937 [Pomacea canaliculata]
MPVFYRFLMCILLFWKPACSNLPPFDPAQEQVSNPPEVNTAQKTSPPPTRPPQSAGSGVDFDFKGFFDHFTKVYGNESLSILQYHLNDRINADGLTPASNTLSGPPVPCGEAPSLPGSSITYKNPLRSHGSMASYTCNTGYTGNSEAIVCQSGKWTDPVNPVICTIVTCPVTPPHIPNSNYHMTTSIYGSQVTYTCKSGFQAVGIASPASCQQNGQWTQPNFKCANMMEMMAHNNAYQSLSSAGGSMASMLGNSAMSGMGAPTGVNTGLEAMLVSAMQGATRPGSLSSGQLPSYLQGAVSSMALGMGGSVAGMAGMPGSEPASLPPHLQSAASMGLMDPNIMRTLMPGMNFGAPGTGAVAGRAMEPEVAMEMLMMSQMMQNMQRQRQAQQSQKKQQRIRQQTSGSSAQSPNLMATKSAVSASHASLSGRDLQGSTGPSSGSSGSQLKTSGSAGSPMSGNNNPLMDAIMNAAGLPG